MPVLVSEAERRAVIEALRQCAGNVTDTARLLRQPISTINSRVSAAIRDGCLAKSDLDEWRRGDALGLKRLPQTADECWALLDAAIGRQRNIPKPPKYVNAKQRRYLIGGDFHAPFHDVEAVAAFLNEPADTCIVNGDLQDFYSISRFTKYEDVSIERELAAVDAILGQLSATFPDVLIVQGNHDKPRFEKQLRQMLSLEMIHVLEFLTGGEFSAIRVLAKRYKNIRFADVQVGRHHLGWFAQEGDLLVAHAEKFSRVPGSALRGIEEWFTDRNDTLGLKPWRVLVQAHTHQLGWFPWHSDQLLVEGGCLCGVHGYQLDARIAGRPQRLGYVTLTQQAGVTDLGSVRCHWLDPQLKAA